MVHHGERLPLGLESRDHSMRVHARLYDLQRYLATHGLLLLRHVDYAEPAFADLLQQFVGSDHGSRLFRHAQGCTRRSVGVFIGRAIA